MASNNFTVIFDACVLYPATLRDFLMTLATVNLFRAKWTDDIHDEWTSALLAHRQDLKPEHLTRVRQKMNDAVLDSLVERSKYASLIPSLSLPDPKDRHVLAAAIAVGAEMIVTLNLKDFPSASLKNHAIAAVHPDNFVLGLIEIDEHIVFNALETQRRRLRNPPKTPNELLMTLAERGLPETVKRLMNML